MKLCIFSINKRYVSEKSVIFAKSSSWHGLGDGYVINIFVA